MTHKKNLLGEIKSNFSFKNNMGDSKMSHIMSQELEISLTFSVIKIKTGCLYTMKNFVHLKKKYKMTNYQLSETPSI